MHSIIRPIVIAASLLGAKAQAQAQVIVTDPWVRATVAQQKATGAFMRLSSPKAVQLVSASSPLTPSVQVHEMAMQGDVMRMRRVQSLELPAGKRVELKPGGYHIMMMNLKQGVKEGGVVPLTLVFEHRDGSREQVEVQAPVRALHHAPGNASASRHGGH